MTIGNVVEIVKASFGLLVLALLGWLAWHIVHGEVTQANSYGLDAITGGLLSLAGAYGQWAFGARIAAPSEPSQRLPPPPPPPPPLPPQAKQL